MRSKESGTVRYAYGVATALLLGGTAFSLATGSAGAQVAQNAPAAIAPGGGPISFADLSARLQPAVVNISTRQRVPVRTQADPLEEFFRRFGFPDPGGSQGPGQQGGPLEHVVAAKAVAFKVCATEEFKERQRRTLEGARILAERLVKDDVKAVGVDVLSGGTDVHLVLVDLRNSELDGQQAEDRLHEVGITVNRNAIPNDPRPPMVTSGLRIGTPALATRGFTAEDFTEVADVIAETLKPSYDVEALRARVTALAGKHPLYPGLK